MSLLVPPSARRLALAASLLTASVTALASSGPARADLPAPPGIRRVSYSFKVSGEIPAAMRLVGYPAYFDGSSTPELAIGREYMLHQGYQPGLYAIAAAKLGDFPRDYKEAETWLAANAKVCLEKVPRVFSIKDEADLLRVKDELRIESMSEAGCKVVPIATTYEMSDGKTLSGTFAEGRRVPPTEIASAFDDSTPPKSAPPVAPPQEAGSAAPTSPTGTTGVSATPSTGGTSAGAGTRVGCRCVVGAGEEADRSIAIAAALAFAAAAARRARRQA